jgi:hypothetical protein
LLLFRNVAVFCPIATVSRWSALRLGRPVCLTLLRVFVMRVRGRVRMRGRVRGLNFV